MKKIIYLLIIFAVNLSFSQDYTSAVKSYLNQNQSNLALQSQDFSDIVIESQSFSKSLKSENVYVAQRYRGVKIFNSVSPFVIKNGVVVTANMASFVKNISSKANAAIPSVSAEVSIMKAASQLGLPVPTNISLLETGSNNSYVFSNGNISLENIPVSLVYQRLEGSESLRLAWDLSIYQLDANHYYSVRVDAQTGDIIDTNDWVVNCSPGEVSHSSQPGNSILFPQNNQNIPTQTALADASYRVFPIPLIGPNEGPSELVLDPANPVASPYGWHDTDGTPGAEYTYTRGNNVISQDDINGNNGAGSRAEGGANLVFDFPFNLPETPGNYLDGAITSLFYMNNIMHDVFYQYGFDEEAGNFQVNNYGHGGNAGDFVLADAQDGSGINNANFGTPPDGGAPRMQMYLWSAPGLVLGTFMTVNNGSLAGQYYAYDANFTQGTPLPTTPITSDLVLVEDDNSGTSTDPYDGCDNIINASAINGKIAILRRGSCSFTDKALAAQGAGAIAVIVVNNEPADPIRMTGSGTGINIPAIMIFQSDGEDIIASLLNGDTINTTLKNDGSGVDTNLRDGDIDNVVIAHEYGHGISNRLTGGAAAAGCLQNAEQMGEGWSDYFGLMVTMKSGDQGTDPRGFATYVAGEGVGGVGLRGKPYSTDMAINDFTYDLTTTAPFQEVHALGSIWTAMLWDLTWDFIDEYGYDPDIYNGTGGNNIALQLVMDGLKIQPCSPGFVDGRDAILQADEIANGGANKCIIWRAFAKRGLGLSADQGSSFSLSDQVPAYDVPADCQLGISDRGTSENNFIIYPNPSDGIVYIKAKQDLGNVSISIFDMNGRKVYSQKTDLHSTANIDASGLRTGIYLITIEGSNYTQTTKLLIN